MVIFNGSLRQCNRTYIEMAGVSRSLPEAGRQERKETPRIPRLGLRERNPWATRQQPLVGRARFLELRIHRDFGVEQLRYRAACLRILRGLVESLGAGAGNPRRHLQVDGGDGKARLQL